MTHQEEQEQCKQQKKLSSHPYLSGNFAPVTKTSTLTPVGYTGTIPKELHGGMYVRNGGNPIVNSDLGRKAHWFDGDGMLTGVWFSRSNNQPDEVMPHFVNQYVLTDLAISSFENKELRTPILPSIATLVDPLARLWVIVWSILRSVYLVFLSHLPGSTQAIKKISVANTHIVYHDGRALATCESGPPMRVQLPGLETVGWYDGIKAEGEPEKEIGKKEAGFGGTGFNSWMREWTTAHPKIDPDTGEMVLFHCNFLPPYVHYSVIPKEESGEEKMISVPVPGCSGGKMMHDFGVSKHHTIILDLPLTLSPINLLKNNPIVTYEPDKPSRFGVFPRRNPSAVRWFETTGCCIFHTANTWDEHDAHGNVIAVNMLACRLTSASLVFSAGNIPPPPRPNHSPSHRKSFFTQPSTPNTVADPEKTPLLSPSQTSLFSSPPDPPIPDDDEEQCRLYHYRFDLQSRTANKITHEQALSHIPFEFPTVNPAYEMRFARYIYGCSTSATTFGAALGSAAKIDRIVKMDVRALITEAEGKASAKTEREDSDANEHDDENAPTTTSHPTPSIQTFTLPPHHYTQEPRFIPRTSPTAEDDGYLLFYVFNETQLDAHGQCLPDATSELWVVDARDMRNVVARIRLSERVPYGLHGNWFGEGEIGGQRGVGGCRGEGSRGE
ncbi:carotenoid oxygenase [Massarina eburnea CBS 473.64]|uniref:Carotenoid oxygenase n=1 Tax=Massarina eburnea CBS 473.64 TaxID=1395130 RepID=A0A6A6S7D8_9PLEO|nr:carotenoid oxygenase [Massarina eburnea CBS 473.64]